MVLHFAGRLLLTTSLRPRRVFMYLSLVTILVNYTTELLPSGTYEVYL
jgi:hypothetical protein